MIDTFIDYIGKRDDEIKDTPLYNSFHKLKYDDKKHNDKEELFILINASICFLVNSTNTNILSIYNKKEIQPKKILSLKRKLNELFSLNTKEIKIPYVRYCYFYLVFHNFIKDKDTLGIHEKNILEIKINNIKDIFLRKCCLVYYILNDIL